MALISLSTASVHSKEPFFSFYFIIFTFTCMCVHYLCHLPPALSVPLLHAMEDILKTETTSLHLSSIVVMDYEDTCLKSRFELLRK
jgi:hypothetical protein